MQVAPKVGKQFFSEGSFFQEILAAVPDMKIVRVETCKGADRCRPPPKGINSQQAPFRRSFGIHRQSAQVFL